MNKDFIKKKVIEYFEKIDNNLDKIHKGEEKYQLLYKLIYSLLRKDLEATDKSLQKRQNIIQNKIPYKFWIMWWQGISKAPIIVQKNIKSLQKLFGEENVTIIDKYNYTRYTDINPTLLKRFNDGRISVTSWSDIVRFNILKVNGGYWIDSTVAISATFKEYFLKLNNQKFFTLSISNDNNAYRYISYSKWALWFLGGVKNFELFVYMDKFYEVYFSNHHESIDYFLTDDAISYYYSTHKSFKEYCKQNEKNWKPYLWMNSFNTANDNKNLIDSFNKELKYSVQKITYKYDSKLLDNPQNFISFLLEKKW